MKMNIKRLFALVLTICMLASLMVPVAFADDEAVEAPSANVAETYPIRLKDMNHTDPLTAEGLDKLMVRTGSSGTRYNNYGLESITASPYAAGTLNWKGYACTTFLNSEGKEELGVTYRDDAMYQARLTKNCWNAIQIRVEDSGLYALNFTTDKTVDTETEETPWTSSNTSWDGSVTAYLIPLADVEAAVAEAVIPEVEEGKLAPTEKQVAISALMTDEYCVGTVSMAADQTDISFAKTRMNKGEYVVVYKASHTYYCLSEISLLETAEDAAKFEPVQIANYQIRIFDPESSLEEQYVKNSVLLSRFITKGTDEAGNTTYTATTSQVSVSKVDQNKLYSTYGWKVLAGSCSFRPDTYQYRLDKNVTTTFQIKVPASGYFALTLSTLSQTAKYSADIYAVNVNDKGDTAYANLSTAENYIGSIVTSNGTGETNLKYYEAGEYIVNIANTTNDNMWINTLGLIQYPIDVLPESTVSNTQIINTALYEISDPGFDQVVSKVTTFASELTVNGEAITLNDYVDAQYAAGKLDWKIENYADLFEDKNFGFNEIDNGGLHIRTTGTSVGDWAALRIRVTAGDRYSIALSSGRSSNAHTTYMFPATSAEMSVEEIEAQMTNANVLYTTAGQAGYLNRKISVGYLDGEYILVFKAPHEDTSRNVFIDKIVLETETFTSEDVQKYNFYMFDETNPYYNLVTDRYEAVTDDAGATTYQPIDGFNGGTMGNADGFVLERDAEGNPTSVGEMYNAIYNKTGAGYPNTLNWRPDATKNTAAVPSLKETLKLHYFSYYASGDIVENAAYRINFTDAASDFVQYGSLMLHVDKAGTYDLSILVPKFASVAKIYFVDTYASSYSAKTTDATIQSLIADDTYLLGGNENGYTGLVKRKDTKVGTVEIDAAGDFLLIFVVDNTGESTGADYINNDICLTSITLTPVVEEAGAGVGGETYATFEEAVKAAQPGDTIHLMDNVFNGDDIVIPNDVTLNLNGLNASFNSVAVAPGAQIIDSSDGKGLIRGDVTFATDNAQLPLYDVAADGYRLFNVDVDSVATTGKYNTSKYWFKINFSNANAFELMDLNTELRIGARMAGIYEEGHEMQGQEFVGRAEADLAFSLKWAQSNSSYIVLSRAGSGSIDNFTLNPAVSANGVTITGDAMTKGA